MFTSIVKCIPLAVILAAGLMTGCAVTPKEEVRIEDRLWIERDYDRRLSEWPVPYTLKRVLTRYGHTQVLISGEEHENTIILLHAMGLNLTSWVMNAEALSQNNRIIAVDMIGDQGRSIVRRDYPKNIEEISLWLDDLVTELDLQRFDLVGASMGGWIAHGYAIHYPEKVHHLVLINPAAGIPAKTKWMGIIMKMIFTNDEAKLKRASAKLLGPGQASEDWLDYMGKASKDSKSAKLGRPKDFSREDLAKTGGAVLLLVGESDYIYKSSEDLIALAEATMPNVTTVMIPDAGHLAAWDNPEFVNSEILKFIERH